MSLVMVRVGAIGLMFPKTRSATVYEVSDEPSREMRVIKLLHGASAKRYPPLDKSSVPSHNLVNAQAY